MKRCKDDHSWAVVLAGGDGTRLLELTRQIAGDARPKQFCNLLDDKTLLDNTRDRIAPLFNNDRVRFSLTRSHRTYYEEQLCDVPDEHRIVQPANRGTAIALCLRRIAQQDEDATVAFFPADHYYLDQSAFRDCVELGREAAVGYPHHVLMLGAEATYPEVEYGWIQPGQTLVDSIDKPAEARDRVFGKTGTAARDAASKTRLSLEYFRDHRAGRRISGVVQAGCTRAGEVDRGSFSPGPSR